MELHHGNIILSHEERHALCEEKRKKIAAEAIHALWKSSMDSITGRIWDHDHTPPVRQQSHPIGMAHLLPHLSSGNVDTKESLCADKALLESMLPMVRAVEWETIALDSHTTEL